MSVPDEEAQRVVVRDKRRVDPESGAVREEVPSAEETPVLPGEAVEAQLAERTADLQRLKAEYDNYRKRVERDRALAAEAGVVGVLAALLPVLDDVDRAREHGELDGAFKAVAETLEGELAKFGLARFGAAGDPFDPTVHEAVTHSYDDELAGPTCVTVMRPGYRVGERLLRPAMVAVGEPATT